MLSSIFLVKEIGVIGLHQMIFGNVELVLCMNFKVEVSMSKQTINKQHENEMIDAVMKMATESLDPEKYNNLSEALEQLKKNRNKTSQDTCSKLITITVGDLFTASYEAVIESKDTINHGSDHVDAHHVADDIVARLSVTNRVSQEGFKFIKDVEIPLGRLLLVKTDTGKTHLRKFTAGYGCITSFDGDGKVDDSGISFVSWRDVSDE